MAQRQVAPITSITRCRPLTRRHIRASIKRLSTLQLTTNDPPSLLGLPREPRDEIFWLAVQDEADLGRDSELVSGPNSTITPLTQVSRNVRTEAANIYWSRTKFHYSTHNLATDDTHRNDCGRCRLGSWLSTWGILAVPHVRLLKIKLSFQPGALDMQLSKYARPSIIVWTGNGFGAEESLKTFVTPVLFPDGRSTMAPEALEKMCGVLHEVGRIISNTEGYFLEKGCVDRAERMEQKRAEVAELLSLDRLG